MNQRATVLMSIFTLTILAMLTTSASATQWECGERSNLSIDGKNYCAAGDFRQTQVNLNKVLDVLVKKHESAFGDTSALSDAQTAFESYRDNQCAAESQHIKAESYYPMIVAQCKTRFTNQRIEELKRMKK